MSKPPQPAAAPRELLRAAILRIANREITPADLDTFLHTLLVTGGDTDRRHYRARHKATDEETTRTELRKVADAADALKSALEGMHAPAAAMIGQLDQHIIMANTLSIVARGASTQPVAMATVASAVGKKAASNQFSPQENLAFKAAMVFAQVTGTKPTRVTRSAPVNANQVGYETVGPFVLFLRNVFAARGVTASADRCAKVALAAMDA